MISEELLKIAKPLLYGRKVLDLVVGLRYTALLLDENCLGLAFTLKGPYLTGEKRIFPKNPHEIADLIVSTSPIEASIGLAAVNAASQMRASKMDLQTSESLLDALKLSKHDSILMVGLMTPLAWELHSRVCKIWAVEDTFSAKEGPPNLEVRPWWALDIILQRERISAVLVSGSAVGNKTIDRILEIANEKGSKVALVGPSVPIFPRFWKTKGVDVLAASLIINPNLAIKLIKTGCGSRDLFRKGCLKKVILDLKQE